MLEAINLDASRQERFSPVSQKKHVPRQHPSPWRISTGIPNQIITRSTSR